MQQAYLKSLTPDAAKRLAWQWRGWLARPAQLAPDGAWYTWRLQAGRGFGKTRSAAEYIRELAEAGRHGRIALIGQTDGDVRKVMVEGESGLLAISPPHFRPRWNPSRRLLTWPNGVLAETYSDEEPDRLRGPQHHAAWGDEPAKWRHLDTISNLLLGLRLGEDTRLCLSGTPSNSPVFKTILKLPNQVVTGGSSRDNLANLAPSYKDQVLALYQGTRLGRQEIDGLLLDDVEGALWQMHWLDANRVTMAPDLARIVVAVDPSVEGEGAGDACGIVVAGIGTDGHGYVLADHTLNGSPLEWATAAVAAYHTYKADALIAEANNGGALVQVNLGRIDNAPHVGLVHASRGKHTRAEPVANLDQQGRIHHVGYLPVLEEEMCGWVPGEGKSPNRIDARVWALSELHLKPDVSVSATTMPHSAGPVDDLQRVRLMLDRYRDKPDADDDDDDGMAIGSTSRDTARGIPFGRRW